MVFDCFSSSYKKGLVLGLTFAETVILIIFCLLLLFFVITKHKDEEIQALLSTERNIKTYSVVYQQLQESFLNKTITDSFKKIVLARKTNYAIKQLNSNKTINMEEIKKATLNITELSETFSDKQKLSLEDFTQNIVNNINKTDKN